MGRRLRLAVAVLHTRACVKVRDVQLSFVSKHSGGFQGIITLCCKHNAVPGPAFLGVQVNISYLLSYCRD